MSETKNGGLGLYGAKHLKYNHMMTLGFKGLKQENIHILNLRLMQFTVYENYCNST